MIAIKGSRWLLIMVIVGWIPLNLHSQALHRGIADFEIIYNYAIDRSEVKEVDKEIPPYIKKMATAAEEIASKLEGRLIFNNKSSVYWSPEGVSAKNREEGLANALVSSDQKFYYYHPEGILYIEKIQFGKKTHLKDDKSIEWEILPDQTVINGLVCRKATGTFKSEGWNDTKVEVWFAPDLPFPFGPVAAYGLPGVILKYQKGVFVITANSIKRISDQGEEIVILDFGDVPSLSESLK